MSGPTAAARQRADRDGAMPMTKPRQARPDEGPAGLAPSQVQLKRTLAGKAFVDQEALLEPNAGGGAGDAVQMHTHEGAAAKPVQREGVKPIPEKTADKTFFGWWRIKRKYAKDEDEAIDAALKETIKQITAPYMPPDYVPPPRREDWTGEEPGAEGASTGGGAPASTVTPQAPAPTVPPPAPAPKAATQAKAIPSERVDERFDAEWAKYARSPAQIDQALKDTIRIITVTYMPPGYVPPPLRTGAGAASAPEAEKPKAAQGTDPQSIAIDIANLPSERVPQGVIDLMPADFAATLEVVARLSDSQIGPLKTYFPLSREDRIGLAIAVVELGRSHDETVFPKAMSEVLLGVPAAQRQVIATYLAEVNPTVGCGVDQVLHDTEDALDANPVGLFKQRVKAKAIEQLKSNLAVLDGEEAKYADTRAESPQWKHLRERVVPLARKYHALTKRKGDLQEQRANLMHSANSIDMTHNSGTSGTSPTSGDQDAAIALDAMGGGCARGQPAEDGSPSDLADLHRCIASDGEQISQIDQVQTQLRAEYPIISGITGDTFEGGKSNQDVYATLKRTFFADVRKSIHVAIDKVQSETIGLWELEQIQRDVEVDLGIEGRPEAKRQINAWRNGEREKRKDMEAAVVGKTIVLGLLSLVLPGIGGVVAGLLGALIGLDGAADSASHAKDRSDIASAGVVGEHLIDNPDEAREAYWDAVMNAVLSVADSMLAVRAAGKAAVASRARPVATLPKPPRGGAAAAAGAVDAAGGAAKAEGAAAKTAGSAADTARVEGAATKASEGAGAAKAQSAAAKGASVASDAVTAEIAGAKAAGQTKDAAQAVLDVAERHQVRIRFRKTNKYAAALIEAGHSPKPAALKMKTINELDVHLGVPPDKLGQVGYFKPEGLPANIGALEKADPDLVQRIRDRFVDRRAEFNKYASDVATLEAEGTIAVRDGVVVDMRAGSGGKGKAFTGDNDVFDIVGADGAPLDAARKRTVMAELEKEPISAQHGAHMDWNTANADEAGMKQKIIDQHRAGGEALVEFGPGRSVGEVYAQ